MGLYMTSAKILRPENTTPCLNNKEGKDVQFGPPPEEYSYRCSQCRYEMKVNEAIVDFEIGMAEFAGTYYEDSCPLSVVRIAIKKQWNTLKPKSPPEGR